jgi:hypothetical protein
MTTMMEELKKIQKMETPEFIDLRIYIAKMSASTQTDLQSQCNPIKYQQQSQIKPKATTTTNKKLNIQSNFK